MVSSLPRCWQNAPMRSRLPPYRAWSASALLLTAAMCLPLASALGVGCSDEPSGNLAAGTQGGGADGTGASGSGGSGGCTGAGDCPMWKNECGVRNCKSGVCGADFEPASTPTNVQQDGDCLEVVCDGMGEVMQVPDDGDQPNDDNQCTANVCMDGVPTFPPLPEGTECNNDSTCNAVGLCIECLVAADCPGRDDECETRTCNADICGVAFTAAGTPVAMQTAGDCVQDVCDGNGDIVSEDADNDIQNDMNACTDDTCDNGTPVHTPKPMGTPCGASGMCNAQGQCI
jgi:hypothetical protein